LTQLASINLEAVPFREYAKFLAFLPNLNASCEGVQYRLRFCLDQLSCAKMEVFSFGQTKSVLGGQFRQEDWMGDDSGVAFGKKIH
jgi:hypothetical protein